MATPFKLKSGNASAFKNLGSSPMKEFNMTGSIKAGEKIVSKVDVANALKVKTQNFRDAANKIKTVSSKTNKGSKVIQALKNTPKQYIKPAEEILKTTNRNLISGGKQILKKGAKNIVKGIGLLPTLMLTPMSASANDQPTKGKGKIEYPGGKIDFTKKK